MDNTDKLIFSKLYLILILLTLMALLCFVCLMYRKQNINNVTSPIYSHHYELQEKRWTTINTTTNTTSYHATIVRGETLLS
jgi:hypothetical protein